MGKTNHKLLQVSQKIRLRTGYEYVVEYVDEYRAKCKLISVLKPREDVGSLPDKIINISPFAEVELI